MSYAPAVISARPGYRSRALTAVLIAAAAALTAVAAQWRIPLWPVPVTGQTFAVLLGGAVLGWRAGGAAQLLYLVVGAAGVPVFTDTGAGLAYFSGPTAGYLLAFPLAAALVGRLAERRADRRFWSMTGAFVLGSAVIYLGGMTGLVLLLDMTVAEAFTAGVVPFLVGDAVKAAAAGVLLPAAWRFARW